MGFPSPAADYVEQTLTVSLLCNINANSLVIETSAGYAVIDRSLRCKNDSVVLINADGRNQFAKIAGRTFVTDDEVIYGRALDDVSVLGRVTFFISSMHRDEYDGVPVM